MTDSALTVPTVTSECTTETDSAVTVTDTALTMSESD